MVRSGTVVRIVIGGEAEGKHSGREEQGTFMEDKNACLGATDSLIKEAIRGTWLA